MFRRPASTILIVPAILLGGLGALGAMSASRQSQGRDGAHRFRVEVVAKGLLSPWSLASAPGGRLFIAQRGGRILRLDSGRADPVPWGIVPTFDAPERSFESGLMGFALDPGYPGRAFAYVCYTWRDSAGAMHNRIARLWERDGRAAGETILFDRIPAAAYHNGCRLKFGPDGKLYASTGDAQADTLAQLPGSSAGKILRLNPDGSVPGDNPIPGSPVWSLGHRNAQGLAWQPGSNRLFVPEHGTGGIDELNIVEAGGNYGWPVVRGRAADTRYRDPALVFVAAPTGAAFLPGSRYPGLAGLLAVASLSGQRVLLIRPGEREAEIVEDSALTGYGRLRDVIVGTDGYLYVATSNRDGRGTPQADDDRVLRLLPAAPR